MEDGVHPIPPSQKKVFLNITVQYFGVVENCTKKFDPQMGNEKKKKKKFISPVFPPKPKHSKIQLCAN